jgi:hypothetical protein
VACSLLENHIAVAKSIWYFEGYNLFLIFELKPLKENLLMEAANRKCIINVPVSGHPPLKE